MRARPYGPRAVLVECDLERPADVARAVRDAGLTGVREVVAGARTVVIECDDASSADAALAFVGRTGSDAATVARPGETRHDVIVVPVRFDGADLDEVATLAGTSPSTVIDLLTSSTLHVAFCGFAPGFAYLEGLPDRLHLPRRPTPRERVAPGSVALAAGFAAVYPSASPGGWHLVGHTDVRVWSVDRDPPALLQPGIQVRFEVETTRSG